MKAKQMSGDNKYIYQFILRYLYLSICIIYNLNFFLHVNALVIISPISGAIILCNEYLIYFCYELHNNNPPFFLHKLKNDLPE